MLFVVRQARATARWCKSITRSAVVGETPTRFPKIPCMAYGSRDTKKERHKTAAPLKSGLAFGKIAAMELPAHDLAAARTVRIDQAVQIFYAPMSHRSANPYAQMSPLSSADSFATISAVSPSLSVTSSLVPYASTYPVPSTNWRGCIIIASGCMNM